MTLEKYFVAPTPDGNWSVIDYDDYAEAREAAYAIDGCVIAVQFESVDSELVCDYREDEEDE